MNKTNNKKIGQTMVISPMDAKYGRINHEETRQKATYSSRNKLFEAKYLPEHLD